jgi:hypothetical protein
MWGIAYFECEPFRSDGADGTHPVQVDCIIICTSATFQVCTAVHATYRDNDDGEAGTRVQQEQAAGRRGLVQ